MNNNFNVLIVAPRESQAKELFDRVRKFVVSCDDIREEIGDSFAIGDVKFKNGSRIKTVPTGTAGESIHGYTANLLVLEEAGLIKDDIVATAAMPTIAATNGQIIKIGTPRGKNHFYRSAYEDKNYKFSRVSYEEPLAIGQLSKEFIDEMMKEPEIIVKTQLRAEFIEDIDAYFPQGLIEQIIEDLPEQNAIEPNSEYYLGVDFARMGEDSSVFIVLQHQLNLNRLVVAKIVETKHKLLTDAIGRVIMLNEIFNFKKIYLDETGLGSGPTDILREKFFGRIEPVTFTLKSKQDLYSNLKSLMEQHRILIPNDRKLIYELSDLRYELTSTGDMKIHHSERGHDDYPSALSLACFGFRRVTIRPAIA